MHKFDGNLAKLNKTQNSFIIFLVLELRFFCIINLLGNRFRIVLKLLNGDFLNGTIFWINILDLLWQIFQMTSSVVFEIKCFNLFRYTTKNKSIRTRFAIFLTHTTHVTQYSDKSIKRDDNDWDYNTFQKKKKFNQIECFTGDTSCNLTLTKLDQKRKWKFKINVSETNFNALI